METHNKTACPLQAIDKRLEDVHRMWHQAEQNYFDPEQFRVSVQSAIQTLRTVTFILQKNKNIVPNFDEWYGVWQKKMRDNQLMRWMVDARNKIEKQGDLESQSYVKTEIISSYLEQECPAIEVPAELFKCPFSLLKNIPKDFLEQHLRKHGTFRIRRRWVENSLPDYELLDAIAIAYGHISELVHDAHLQMNLNPPVINDCNSGKEISSTTLGWRLPCMIGHEEYRDLLLSLKDGLPIQLDNIRVKKDPAFNEEKIIERYGKNPFKVMKGKYKSPEEMADAYFQMASNVFLKDKYHLNFTYFFSGTTLVNLKGMVFGNQQEKYLTMRHLAQEAARSGADGVIMISEAWYVKHEEISLYQRPAESPAKEEVLLLGLATKQGNSIQYSSEIIRNGKDVSLGQTVKKVNASSFIFAPFYEMWGKKIPQEWTDKLKESYRQRSNNTE